MCGNSVRVLNAVNILSEMLLDFGFSTYFLNFHSGCQNRFLWVIVQVQKPGQLLIRYRLKFMTIDMSQHRKHRLTFETISWHISSPWKLGTTGPLQESCCQYR